jgi:hypothetical protein
MSHGRWALAGTARVATRAIETIASPVIWPSRIACLCSRLLNHPGRGRERACHCGGFHVHSGRATPIIWQSLTGPKYRLSKE